ncbi:MAG: hypothetical protein AB1631_24475 [Acidobacteriota bacterium]
MLKSVSIRQEGERVLLIEDGRLILDMPWQAAIEVARAIYQKAKQAEQLASVDRLIIDQAVLLRAGVPFGLTSHPLILRESVKEALSNRQLRRYMPGGIRSQSVVGSPTILQHKPKEN